MFMAPREGISSLVAALAARLPGGTIELNAPVERLDREDGKWIVRQSRFEHLILATPAHATAKLLAPLDAEVAADLQRIPYAGCAIALVGYRRENIDHALDGFGFVVPEIENRRILAASFSSNKFPGRAPEGCLLLRVFLGGARHPEMVDMDDGSIRQIVTEELADILGARGEPCLFEVARWHNAMCHAAVSSGPLAARATNRAAGGHTSRPGIGRQRLSRRRHSRLHPQRRAGRGIHSEEDDVRNLALILLLIPSTASTAEPAYVEKASLAAPEASQAAAADERFVYAIDNRVVAKYDRETGKRLAVTVLRPFELSAAAGAERDHGARYDQHGAIDL
jgi:hypothetical protein